MLLLYCGRGGGRLARPLLCRGLVFDHFLHSSDNGDGIRFSHLKEFVYTGAALLYSRVHVLVGQLRKVLHPGFNGGDFLADFIYGGQDFAFGHSFCHRVPQVTGRSSFGTTQLG